mgnify:CR=1 FL=1
MVTLSDNINIEKQGRNVKMKAAIIKELREEKGISQSELAKAMNVSRSTITMMENGSREGSIQLLTKMADYFGVTVDYLEGKVDYKESLVSNFLNFLVSNKIIEDENNIDEKTQEMILDMVKKEIKNIKGGK